MDSNILSKMESIRYVNTDCSPSHLFNNLTASDKNIMYIHNSEIQPRIIIIDRKLLSEEETPNLASFVIKLNSNETNEMLTIKCVNLNNNYYVAVGLYGGFKLWSTDGSRLLFQIPNKVKGSEKPYAFTAISEFKFNSKNNGYDSIVCADNYGQVFLVSGFSQNWRAKLLYSYEGQTCTALASGLNSDFICAGFETGEIHILRMKNENLVEVAVKLDSIDNLPVLTMTVLESSKNILIAGFLNGEVKLFNLSSNFELMSAIGAHLRLITNVISHKNYFITCGDDCYVNIWKVDSQDNISVVGNYDLCDKMPVGTAIIEKDGKTDLVVSSFDCTSLAVIENLNI